MFNFCEIERELRTGGRYNQGWLLEISNLEELLVWYNNRSEVMALWEDLKSPDVRIDCETAEALRIENSGADRKLQMILMLPL